MKNKTRYNLFRTKISFPRQTNLFLSVDETPQTIFEKCLKKQTSIKYRENHVWKAGNIHEINDDGGYFAFGKVSLSDLEVFDNEAQDFKKAKYTAGLHSIVVFSKKYELFAIQVNHKLGLTENELSIILVTNSLIQKGVNFITPDIIALKMTLDFQEIDTCFTNLIKKDILTLGGANNIQISIEPLKKRLVEIFTEEVKKETDDLI